ncbi:MAG: 3-deoxy-D-manno-octulosonic acid transferase [Alphaproteobacteria bacterium]
MSIFLSSRQRQGKEDAERLSERFGYASHERPEGKLVWIHAASVGEVMSTLLLIQKLAAQHAHAHFLITTGTVTSARVLATRMPPRTVHQFVPVDVPECVTRFMEHWQPDLALWIESELWPNLLYEIRKRKIPAAFINARMSVESQRNWLRFKSWIGDILGTFSVCLTQTEAGQASLRALGAKNVGYCGNLKFAALPLPDNADKREALAAAITDRPVWLFAQSHDGEEAIALEVHRSLIQDYPALLTVIAPRHPVRAPAIVAEIAKAGFSSAQRSLKQMPAAETAIYLADTMGEMGLLYRLVPVCCVGGSFVPVGGHNPIEPALLGSAVAFGPLMANIAEVAEQMLAAKAAKQVGNADELAAFVSSMLQDNAARDAMAENAKAFATAQGQVHDRVIAALAPLIEQAGLA